MLKKIIYFLMVSILSFSALAKETLQPDILINNEKINFYDIYVVAEPVVDYNNITPKSINGKLYVTVIKNLPDFSKSNLFYHKNSAFKNKMSFDVFYTPLKKPDDNNYPLFIKEGYNQIVINTKRNKNDFISNIHYTENRDLKFNNKFQKKEHEIFSETVSSPRGDTIVFRSNVYSFNNHFYQNVFYVTMF